MSQCTALLNQKSDFRGGLDSGFSSCAAPTYYCTYFYNQCPQVWKLIGTKHSLNRDEHRVIIKLEFISNGLEIGVWNIRVMSEVVKNRFSDPTKGQ